MASITVNLSWTYDDTKPFDFGDRMADLIEDLINYEIDYTEIWFVDGKLREIATRDNHEPYVTSADMAQDKQDEIAGCEIELTSELALARVATKH
jgi:hypothetical protein